MWERDYRELKDGALAYGSKTIRSFASSGGKKKRVFKLVGRGSPRMWIQNESTSGL